MSRVNPGELLHKIVRRCDVTTERMNVSPEDQPLQVGVMRIEKGQSFRPHIHKPRESVIRETQESWVVVFGEVIVNYYDVDGSPLGYNVLAAGDCSITYRGGHGYKCLQDALVYEFKNGPYHGVEADKEFI